MNCETKKKKVLNQRTQFRVIMTVLRGACFDSSLVLTANVLSRSYWIRTRYIFSFEKKKWTRLINKKILRNMLFTHQLAGFEILNRRRTFQSSIRLTVIQTNCLINLNNNTALPFIIPMPLLWRIIFYHFSMKWISRC